MPGFADYLTWRGDLLFSQDPFHPVDGLLLSTLAYHHFAQYADPPVGVGVPLSPGGGADPFPAAGTVKGVCFR